MLSLCPLGLRLVPDLDEEGKMKALPSVDVVVEVVELPGRSDLLPVRKAEKRTSKLPLSNRAS